MIKVKKFSSINKLGKRTSQEDSIYPVGDFSMDDQRLFMVCDGVGGLEYGATASRTTCERIAEYAATLPLGISDKYSLDRAIEYAREHLLLLKGELNMIGDMATTLTLAFFQSDIIFMAHAGDSKIFQIRGGEVIFSSVDHSAVQEMVASGFLTEAEAICHPNRNRITSSINSHSEPEILGIARLPVENDDIFILCTDGILEGLGRAGIQSIINSGCPESMIKSMDDLCSQFSNDNYSAIVIQISFE